MITRQAGKRMGVKTGRNRLPTVCLSGCYVRYVWLAIGLGRKI